MLKYRLIFGTLMTTFFVALAIFDAWLDGSITVTTADDKPIQATLLCVLIGLLVISAQFEMKKLAAVKKIRIFTPVSITASVIIATWWYWLQIIDTSLKIYLPLFFVLVLFALFIYQYARYGTANVITNCGANYFSILYLGLLSTFVLAIRIDFGIWPFLMFVLVIKSSDIGAYTVGKIFGKHRFSPKISPQKTWEGMAGAVIFAGIVAVLFAVSCDKINIIWYNAVIFGCIFTFVGQLGDLAESMIKRDVEQKDSADNIPGFGGILDIVDSPLVAAPLVYVYFLLFSK